MAEQLTNPQGPALDLFPLFGQYEAMAAQELEGLTDPQLDWTSPRWGWSGWSIRNNISHVASHLFRWYILRWGDQIFPEGIPYRDEVDYLAALSHRQLDKEQWWEIDVILGKLGEAIAMVHGILANETLGFSPSQNHRHRKPRLLRPDFRKIPGHPPCAPHGPQPSRVHPGWLLPPQRGGVGDASLQRSATQARPGTDGASNPTQHRLLDPPRLGHNRTLAAPPSRVLAKGDLCITVIPAPEPESKGGNLGLNFMSILPNMVSHQ